MSIRWAIALSLVALGACSQDELPKSRAFVAGQVRLCETRTLTAKTKLRLVEVYLGEFKGTAYVISLSNSQGAWWPIATFTGFYAPRVQVDPEGDIDIEITGYRYAELRRSIQSDAFRYTVKFSRLDESTGDLSAQGWLRLECLNDAR